MTCTRAREQPKGNLLVTSRSIEVRIWPLSKGGSANIKRIRLDPQSENENLPQFRQASFGSAKWFPANSSLLWRDLDRIGRIDKGS